MPEPNKTAKLRSYCALCQSACPIICSVEEGRLEKVSRDREHPHSSPLCPKGLAGPELVYNDQRLKYPLKRTRPKGDPDPGWQRISWDDALDTIARKLNTIKQTTGAHSVVFNRPGPGGSPSRDYAEWVVRLAGCFGSPNTLATGHVCQWHRDTGSKYTYGWEKVPEADFENTAFMIIWGHNPYTSIRCMVRDINAARKRGARLVVIDPRLTEVAKTADLWLQVRPGTDGALILGLIRHLLKNGTYDETFVKRWTNAPFLVRSDTGNLLTDRDLGRQAPRPANPVWDLSINQVAVDGRMVIEPALFGSFEVRLADGQKVTARPVLESLRQLVSPYSDETVESITGVKTKKIQQLAEDLGRLKPASYFSYNGIEQQTNAMQTNRALCILYALTGNLDKPGGNVFFPSFPGPKIRDPKLLPADVHELRIAHNKRPLGPAGNPNSSAQAYAVFDSILTEKPYPIKALVAFGGNIITANSHSQTAREAIKRLEFFVQTELFMTPSAELADIVLPAATFFEWAFVKKGFPNLMRSRQWVQYRPGVVAPQFEARSDLSIIFDLALRLGYGEKFWNGDIEAAFDAQLKPLDLTLNDLKQNHGGLQVKLTTHYRKYSRTEPQSDSPKGFATPSKRVEIFSQLFKEYGYDPLPAYRAPEISPAGKPEWIQDYPLILTCSKLLHFCHGQQRALPSLRRAVPDPFVEINPQTAKGLNIQDGEWVFVETPFGKIRLKAKIAQTVPCDVVCIQHGWWQSCPELGLPGYDPYTSEGANANLLFSTEAIDPISGSVPYKAYLCRVSRSL